MNNLYLGTFAKLRNANASSLSVCPSVRPHEATRLPPNGFSLRYGI